MSGVERMAQRVKGNYLVKGSLKVETWKLQPSPTTNWLGDLGKFI